MEIFYLTLENLMVYMAFFVVGFVFSRRKMIPEDSGKSLSFLVTNLFTAAICFNTFAKQFTIAKIGEYAVVLIAGAVFMLISVVAGEIAGRMMPGNKYDKLTAAYSIVVPNYGNMGYPLVFALFGQAVLSKFMMFCLPFNFYVFGYMMPQYLPGKPGFSGTVKKIFSVPIIMMLAGIMYGLSGLPYPAVIEKICNGAGDCLGPCSFLIVGIAMGTKPVLPALRESRAYVLTAVRLIVLPAIVIAAAFFLCRNTKLPSELFLILSIYVSMPMGLNPVIFANAFGGDGSLGASCALISMPAALITFPLTRIIIEKLQILL